MNGTNPSTNAGGKERNSRLAADGASSLPGEQDTEELWGDLKMEEVLTRENMSRAFKRVKANKGVAGVDGITVDDLEAHVKTEWPRIRKLI